MTKQLLTIGSVSVTLEGEDRKKVSRLAYVVKQSAASLKQNPKRDKVQELQKELSTKNQTIVVLKDRLDKLDSEVNPMRLNIRQLARDNRALQAENKKLQQEMDKQQGKLITPAGGLITEP
jgi:septal ring factor EnvC (AmiA/AmiB activator)